MQPKAARHITPGILAELDSFLAEDDLFAHEGNVYYRHESGLICVAPIYDLANPEHGTDIAFAASVPEGATAYKLEPGTARERRTDNWTTACDKALARHTFA